MAKKPRAQDLPGMEDRRIKALEEAGADYAEIRDARIALNVREANLKKQVRKLMHKHEKTSYETSEILITLEPPDGEEAVKVKVKKQRVTHNDDDAATGAEAGADE